MFSLLFFRAAQILKFNILHKGLLMQNWVFRLGAILSLFQMKVFNASKVAGSLTMLLNVTWIFKFPLLMDYKMYFEKKMLQNIIIIKVYEEA